MKNLNAFFFSFFFQRKSIIRITTGSQALDELLGGNLAKCVEILLLFY